MGIATAFIDCDALRHNIAHVRRYAPNSRMVAVVKANAYGHGLVEVAKTIESAADFIGVARLSEAIALRQAGITAPIILLEGFFISDDIHDLNRYNIQTAIHCEEQLALLEQTQLDSPVTVWMKLDTGMHRLGVRINEADAFYQRLQRCQNVIQPINLMTHFCCADELTSPKTDAQIAQFMQFAEGKPGFKSLAASGGELAWPASHQDVVRSGVILYGVSPFDTQTAAEMGFLPAMTLKSKVIAVRKHLQGESVGYGARWISPKDTQLAVVAMGYGDGYPRDMPFGTPVLINGQEYPLVGRVSMDMIVVDLGNEHDVRVNDDVIFWGAELPVERIARFSGMSAYELITRLTARVERIYLNKI